MATRQENIRMLVLGFKLAVEAPTDGQSRRAAEQVSILSSRMQKADIEIAKQIFEGGNN